MHAQVHRILFDDAVAFDQIGSNIGMFVFSEHSKTTTLESVHFHPFHFCTINGRVYKMFPERKDVNTYTVSFKSS